MTEPFAFQPSDGPAKLLRLVSHNVRTKLSVRAALVALLAQPLRQVQNDGHGQNMKLASESDQRFACLRLDICRVDNGQTASSKPLAGHVMQHVESVVGCPLRVLVVGNKPAAEIGG